MDAPIYIFFNEKGYTNEPKQCMRSQNAILSIRIETNFIQ